MKYLLSILCLFVLSCDSGGDAITMDDLNGEWWLITSCIEYIGNGCSEESKNCESIEDSYSRIDEGTIISCNINNDPECKIEDFQTFTLSGNSMIFCNVDPDCSQYLEDDCDEIDIDCYWDGSTCIWEYLDDDPCTTGILELNGEILQFIISKNYQECTRILTFNGERKN